MKRMDKPIAAPPQATPADDTQAERMQAAWADAWTRNVHRSGEIYGRLFAGLRDEFAAFAQKRLDANMETAQAWSACRSVTEALELQQSWLRRAIEHYGDQSTRVSELCRCAVFAPEAEPEQSKPVQPVAAAERKPAPEIQPHIQHAAE